MSIHINRLICLGIFFVQFQCIYVYSYLPVYLSTYLSISVYIYPSFFLFSKSIQPSHVSLYGSLHTQFMSVYPSHSVPIYF